MGLTNYLKDTRGEMKHVNWPTRKQTINSTIIVIGLSFLVGLLLGFFDVIFTSALTKVLEFIS